MNEYAITWKQKVSNINSKWDNKIILGFEETEDAALKKMMKYNARKNLITSDYAIYDLRAAVEANKGLINNLMIKLNAPAIEDETDESEDMTEDEKESAIEASLEASSIERTKTS